MMLIALEMLLLDGDVRSLQLMTFDALCGAFPYQTVIDSDRMFCVMAV